MAENSNIEWTHHTFNPWWGCMKVSEGCKNCYAQTLDNRYNHDNPHWGPISPRKPMSDAYWKQPAKWNTEAAAAGEKRYVFCASMADWAEANDTLTHYESQLMVADARLKLFQLIATTPHLVWQLLTKRPENIVPVIESVLDPLDMHDRFDEGNKPYLAKHGEAFEMLTKWLQGTPPANVWLGTSVENQKAAEERIPYLLQIPARVRFLSCEPLLGPLELNDVSFMATNGSNFPSGYNALNGNDEYLGYKAFGEHINWVICGGESGPGARPMHPNWARGLRDQCADAGVAFFFKQWGEYLPDCQAGDKTGLGNTDVRFPSPHNRNKDNTYWKVGKKQAGSLLDGTEYKKFP